MSSQEGSQSSISGPIRAVEIDKSALSAESKSPVLISPGLNSKATSGNISTKNLTFGSMSQTNLTTRSPISFQAAVSSGSSNSKINPPLTNEKVQFGSLEPVSLPINLLEEPAAVVPTSQSISPISDSSVSETNQLSTESATSQQVPINKNQHLPASYYTSSYYTNPVDQNNDSESYQSSWHSHRNSSQGSHNPSAYNSRPAHYYLPYMNPQMISQFVPPPQIHKAGFYDPESNNSHGNNSKADNFAKSNDSKILPNPQGSFPYGMNPYYYGGLPSAPMVSGSTTNPKNPHGYYQPFSAFIPPPSAQNISSSVEASSDDSQKNSKPIVTKPPRKILSIVNPETGEEVIIGPAKSTPKIDVASTQASITSTDAETLSLTQAPKKIQIIDPKDNKPVVLIPESVDQSSNKQNGEVLSSNVESYFKVADKKEEVDFNDLLLDENVCDSVYDDDNLMMDDDLEDYSEEKSDVFDVTGMEFPVLLTRNIRVKYPENTIPFNYPLENEPLRYSTAFLMQFSTRCRGVAQDIKAVAFPEDVPVVIMDSSDSHRGARDYYREGGLSSGKRRDSGMQSSRSYGSGSRHIGRPVVRENVELTNRASDAWTKSVRNIVDEDAALLREVKGILNKLTEAKFEHFVSVILAMDIIRSAVMTGVIDLLFDKAVEEPRYAPLYALLCQRIVMHEIKEREGTMSSEEIAESRSNQANLSLFRRYLVTKCQIEYEHKRAYSKQRIERIISKAAEKEKDGNADDSSSDLALDSTLLSKKGSSDQLTDEDYALIKLKRRVLGNMRFIGELFIIQLISPKIMHQVIQELLLDVNDPEEEEVESVCRLITTIGSRLDCAESAPIWVHYITRLRVLGQHKKLPTRVRFMVQDVIALRNNSWVKPTPASVKQTAPSSTSSTSISSKISRDSRDFRSSRDPRDTRDYRESRDFRDSRDSQKSGRSTNDGFFTSTRNQQPARSVAPQFSGVHRPPVAAAQRPPLNRFLPLEGREINPSINANKSESQALPSQKVDPAIIGRVTSTFDETARINNTKDLVDLLVGSSPSLVSSLILYAMDGGPRKFNHLLNLAPVIRDEAFSSSAESALYLGCLEAFETLDELFCDVPKAFEFAGSLIAVIYESKSVDKLAGILEPLRKRSPKAAGSVALHYAKHLVDLTAKISSPSIESQISEKNLAINPMDYVRPYVMEQCSDAVDSLTKLAANLSLA